MKKLVLLVAVITAISFTSCSNKAKETTVPEAEAPELVQDEATTLEEGADLGEVEADDAPAAE